MNNPFSSLQMPNHGGNMINALSVGMQAGQQIRQERKQEEAEAATKNALLGYGSTGQIAPAFNALLPVNPKMAFGLSEYHQGQEDRTQANNFRSASSRYASGADADKAFQDMLAIDPAKAFAIQSDARTAALEKLKVLDGAYDFAAVHLANVTDDPSYQQVLAGMDERLKPLGVDIRSIAPAQYPGPDGVRSLLMKALNAQEQLSAIDRRDKLEGDIADDEADNARADGEASSRDADRKRRAGIAQKREQRLAQPKPAKAKGKGRVARPTASDGNGNKIEWNGSAWVPLKQ